MHTRNKQVIKFKEIQLKTRKSMPSLEAVRPFVITCPVHRAQFAEASAAAATAKVKSSF
jgi:hypothetical protein